jgi:hypothetical protein
MEDGGHWLVDMVETYTENEMNYIKLRAVETLRTSRFVPDIKPGEEFEVSRRVGYEGWVGWHLEKYENYIRTHTPIS